MTKLISTENLKTIWAKVKNTINANVSPSASQSVTFNGLTLNYGRLRTLIPDIFLFNGEESIVNGKLLWTKQVSSVLLTYWLLIVRSSNGDYNNVKVYIEGQPNDTIPVNIDEMGGYGMFGICIPLTTALKYAASRKIVISG